MRFKTFMRRMLDTGEVKSVPFNETHFRQAGIGYAPSAGMPILEAYQLVNKWNASRNNPRFLYFLA